jgi:hypothetical protein
MHPSDHADELDSKYYAARRRRSILIALASSPRSSSPRGFTSPESSRRAHEVPARGGPGPGSQGG